MIVPFWNCPLEKKVYPEGNITGGGCLHRVKKGVLA